MDSFLVFFDTVRGGVIGDEVRLVALVRFTALGEIARRQLAPSGAGDGDAETA